ncbi:MAG: hypothetical protein M1536_06145 [Firmicutes bacterium]|nr:hypothetical protein [Bacillota bacterium]
MTGNMKLTGKILTGTFLILVFLIFTGAAKTVIAAPSPLPLPRWGEETDKTSFPCLGGNKDEWIIAASARSQNGQVIARSVVTKQSNKNPPKKKKKSYIVKWESPSLMQFFPPAEMKLSIALRRARLHLPVYRIGVAHNGFYRAALVHFWAGKSKSRKLIEAQALRIILTAFRTDPSLSEVDIVAISQRQTEEFKPDVLFSVMAERKILPKIKYNKLTTYWILHQFGMVRYSPELNP